MVIKPSGSLVFLVADDHSIVRKGISFLIRGLYDNAIIHEAASFDEILDKIKGNRIDLLLLDINFPEGNSIKLLFEIREKQPDIKILIFSAHDEEIYSLRYLNAGAGGYLSKTSSEEKVKEAIISMVQKGKYLTETVKEKILESYLSNKPSSPLQLLSNREIEIASLLVKGHSNADICDLLILEKSTVSTYKSRIFEKLSVNNIPALIEIFTIYSE